MPVDVTAAAGVATPDTRLAREATELVRDRTDDLIYHHSCRVYCWGSRHGRNRGLSWEPELLYLGAMFHDLGLNAEFRTSGRRFEVDSADQARSFMALVTAGVEYDVLGIGYDDVSTATGLRSLPCTQRPDFKRRILAAFTEGMAPRPETTFGTVNADVLERFVPGVGRINFVETIERSQWPE